MADPGNDGTSIILGNFNTTSHVETRSVTSLHLADGAVKRLHDQRAHTFAPAGVVASCFVAAFKPEKLRLQRHDFRHNLVFRPFPLLWVNNIEL